MEPIQQKIGAQELSRAEAQRLVVEVLAGVEHHQGMAIEPDPVGNQDVEVGLEGQHAPELRAVTLLAAVVEHELARARGDVSDLVDLDRAGHVQREHLFLYHG